jgi:hypothetical protein
MPKSSAAKRQLCVNDRLCFEDGQRAWRGRRIWTNFIRRSSKPSTSTSITTSTVPPLYFTQNVKDKVEAGVTDALTFDCMAAGTMLAFSFEAYLNFMGARFIGHWNEQADYHTKIDKVFQNLKISPDWSRRPFSSIRAMKKLRDTLAHCQSETVEDEKDVIDKADGQKGKKIDLSGKWERLCSPDMIINAHDDLEEVWNDD